MRLGRRPPLVPGHPLDVEIAVPGGAIQATAETRVEETTLIIEEVAIYRRGTGAPLERLATRRLLREVRWLEDVACVLGCERVRIEGDRSSGSSAAAPGRHVQFEWRIRCRRR
jgi:hypothetical protein